MMVCNCAFWLQKCTGVQSDGVYSSGEVAEEIIVFFLSFLPRKRTLFPRSCIHTKKRQYGTLPIQYAEALMWQFNQTMILHCDHTNQLLQFQRHNSPDKILETIPDMPIERDSDVLPDVFCWSFKAFIMKLPLVLLPSPDMLLVQSKIYDTCDKKTWPAFEVRLN